MEAATKQPALLDRVLIACREHGIQPEMAERHRKCVEHFLRWVKGEGDWVHPLQIHGDRVEDYLDQLPASVWAFAFDVMQFLYGKVLGKSDFVLNWEHEIQRRLSDKVDQLGNNILDSPASGR